MDEMDSYFYGAFGSAAQRPRQAALVTIDVQNTFCHTARFPLGWLVPDQIDVNHSVRVIGQMLRRARQSDVPVIHVRSPASSADEYDFYRIKPAPSDIDIRKYSRSAFDEGGVSNAFHAVLQAKSIDRLVLGGFWLEQCVQASAESALRHGFRVAVVRDACSPLDYARRRLALDEMAEKGAEIIRARDLPDYIRN